MQIYITILLGLTQSTAFAANVLQHRGGSRYLTAFKMEVFAIVTNG